jgi:hypothetical protein
MVLSLIDLISRLNRRIVAPSATRTWLLREDRKALVDVYESYVLIGTATTLYRDRANQNVRYVLSNLT